MLLMDTVMVISGTSDVLDGPVAASLVVAADK